MPCGGCNRRAVARSRGGRRSRAARPCATAARDLAQPAATSRADLRLPARHRARRRRHRGRGAGLRRCGLFRPQATAACSSSRRPRTPARLRTFAGRRVAINGRDSNSGMNLLRAAVADLAGGRPYFSRVIETGAHMASLARRCARRGRPRRDRQRDLRARPGRRARSRGRRAGDRHHAAEPVPPLRHPARSERGGGRDAAPRPRRGRSPHPTSPRRPRRCI